MFEDLFDYLETHSIFGVKLSTVLSLAIMAIIGIILERIVTRYLRKFAKRAHLAPGVTNNLVLTFRLLILIGATAFVIGVGGLPTEWIVTFSALGGAALGFASTKTIGNFVAGLYLLATRPFRVGDYVRIGTVEGIVEEMTINYTKVLTMGNNIVSISNVQIMDRDITNFLFEKEKNRQIYCYTFEINFDHSVSTSKIAGIFGEVFDSHKLSLPKAPSYALLRSDAFGRVYLVYLYVENPQDILSLRPQIAEEVYKRWDIARGIKT